MMGQDYRPGDRYYAMINTLSGKANEKMTGFIEWIMGNPKLKFLYESLLGCDDPTPIVNELWFYYINNMDPMESPTFKEFAFKYIIPSTILNFQLKDNDLSRKALVVGNVKEKEKNIDELD